MVIGMVFEQGVIGNCMMLGTIGKNGELRYLFWPTIDYPQHMHGSLPGIYHDHVFSWLTDPPWERKQRYLDDTNILETVFRNGDLEIRAIDFVFPAKDILARSFSFKSERDRFLRFFHYTDTHLIENPIGDAAYFDKKNDAIITYKRNYYLAYGGSEKTSGYQCGVHGEGSDAFSDVSDGVLQNNSLSLYLGIRGVNSCLSWDVNLESHKEKELDVYLCFGIDKKEAIEFLDFARNNSLFEKTSEKHEKWISTANLEFLNNSRVSALVKRSLFLLKAIHCSTEGGFIAAPCLEPDYRYCWPRDAAYMAYAFDLYGFHHETRSFYLWCKRAQEDDGSWYQRYYIEARYPGPTWGMQCDQGGIILWGTSRHYEFTQDEDFLLEMRESIKRAARHLIDGILEDSLVKSLDLWEERYASNTYTNAAVCAGLRESAKMLDILGDYELSKECKEASENIRNAILNRSWSEEKKRFLKSYMPYDDTIDISLLGLDFPFEILRTDDEKMKSTAEQIEKVFNYKIGGIGRYPTDVYYGGNPWILTTLWLAIYYARLGERDKASNLINFVIDKTPELGLMPEQLDKNTGDFVSAFPLGWSHAMFVIALKELENK